MLTDAFIQSVLETIDSPDVIGVGIAGSYARGHESKYSDVDFDIFVSKLPKNEFDRYTLRYRDDRLISLKYALLKDERAALKDPARAVWAVPGLQEMKIVLDKDGSLTALQKAAQEFNWTRLQSAADKYAGEQVMGCAEEVHKVLNGLARGHESTVLYAVWGLIKHLPAAVIVQRGLLMTSENQYFDRIQESMGRDSKWVAEFRRAWGLDSASSQYQARGAAALRLYRLTAAMLDPVIPEVHREVINRTVRLIRGAGYQ